MTRKTQWTLGVILVAVLLVVGHVYYWYLPRERPGVPAADSLASRLLAKDDYTVSLWMPYPHQNLGQLYKKAGVENETLGALARLVALPTPQVPNFGTMRVPPASELVLAADEDNGRFALCAKVYPLFASFARLSGRLAKNPWLSGGEIYVDGQRLEVAWRGNWWTVASPDLPPLESMVGAEPVADPEALALIQVRRAQQPLPSGRFYLQRRQGGLEVVSSGASEAWLTPFADLDLTQKGVFLLAMSTRRAAPEEAAQAMAFFSLDDVELPELPRVMMVHSAEGEHWELPGASILELAGDGVETTAVGPWTVTALDKVSLRSGRELVPHLGPVLDDSSALRWGLWLDLGKGLAEVSRIVKVLQQVPIVPRRQVERWSDFETALEPLARHYGHLRFEVAAAPSATEAAADAATGDPAAANAPSVLRLRLEPVTGAPVTH